jgi:hypothetical protein
MNERQKRLIEVYDHLRKYYGIHTKTGFAEALHYGRTSLSAAMNGVESYLTDNLFKNICEAYPCVFNLNYLLTGEGDLLTVAEDIHTEDLEKMFNQQPIDHSSLVNAALAAKDETIRALEGSLRDKERIIQLLEKELKDLKQNAEKQGHIREYTDMMRNFASEPTELQKLKK